MPQENDIQQKIEARLAELPQDVQDAVNASDLDEKVRAIGQKFNLHIDQIGGLGDEVMLTLLGFTPLGEFAGALAAQLSLDPVLAQTIAAEVNSQIFLSIRESMQKFAEKRDAVPTAPDAKPAAMTVPAPSAISISTAPAVPAIIGPTTAVIAKPAVPPLSPDMHAAEVMMSQTVVQVAPPQPVAPAAPAEPVSYKADPYREPVE